MKKLSLTLLTVVCTFCMALGAISMVNVSSAKAEAEPAQVSLSATAYKKSVDKDKLLLVTAIKNYDDVYEVGYTFGGDVTEISANKTAYYTEITGATKTWTTKDIFGEDWENAGMIVWEIEYSPANAYTYQAYAKYGSRQKGDLIKNDPETIVEGTEKTTEIEKRTVTVDMDGGKLLDCETEITSLTVNYGTAIDFDDYTAQKDYNKFVKWQYSNGGEYADFSVDTPIVEDITLKAIWKTVATVEQGVTQTYNDNTSVTGTKYTVSATDYAISVAKNEEFKGSLVTFGYCNNGGNYQIGKFTVRITDVTTKKALELIFVLNVDIVNADCVYAGWSYDGVTKEPVSGSSMLGIDLSDKGSGTWYGSQLPRTLKISVGTDDNGNQTVLFNNGFPTGWAKYFSGDYALDLTGFGADGVDIEVEINALNNCSVGSFIIG